jgi:hypothetical protein
MDDYITENTRLRENLLKLNAHQLKLFYSMLVHYFVHHQAFISKQNFLNLWCELNYACAEVDESFPDPYDDHDLLKSFCHNHPYYFIDILGTERSAGILCQHLNDRIDILTRIVDKLYAGGPGALYEYSNSVLGLSENVNELVVEAEKHIKMFS